MIATPKLYCAALVLALCAALAAPAGAQTPAASPAPAWSPPDASKLGDDAWGRLIRYGRDLQVNTPALIGPEQKDPALRYAGSNLTCQSCHLEAGAKKFGLPYVGVYGDFPQYRAREGEVGTIEDRINGCMTRSMNGKPLPLDSAEMKAMVAYIKFLSTGVAVGAPTAGRGGGAMKELDRPADPVRGKTVFADNCVACHGADGQGKRAGVVGDGKGYLFPPLWGPDSFNDGAGMNRLISAANFIRSNMPNGVDWQNPVVSVEDAWDVAAYVQSQPRPHKADLDKDFPVRTEKPVDAGYGPWMDGFDATAHRLGPFTPIRNAVKALAMKKQ